MRKGTVKWFNAQKGYGFITEDNGEDVFVHYTGIVATGFKTLKEGTAVTFEVVIVDGKQQAVNVISA